MVKKLKKKGEMPWWLTLLIIAAVFLVIRFFFMDRILLAKDTTFDTLGIGEDKSEIEQQEDYLKLIEEKYDEVQIYLDKALSPQMTKFQWISDNERYAKQEFEEFKQVCDEPIKDEKLKQTVESECNKKIGYIEGDLIAIECLYWKELGAFEQNLANNFDCSSAQIRGRDTVDSCARHQAEAYLLYAFVIGKYESYQQCGSTIKDAEAKQQEVEQAVENLNLKYPHRDPSENYSLPSLMCKLVNYVPQRDRTDETTKSEISQFNCNYLAKVGESCSICALT
jgi:hypothetical protein